MAAPSGALDEDQARRRRLGRRSGLTHPKEKAMKRNVGTLDRGLRIVAGLMLIALAATGTVGLWGWIGVVPLLTGLMGWCGLYSLLGIDSCTVRA
jgi:hypothetical protein